MITKSKSRPANITDEHLEYLDALRESGVTNMFGAGSYVENEFSVSRREARDILMYWMQTFGQPER
jgi:hypothetical protein